MTMTPEWRPLPGFDGSYEVSSDGQVRSLGRVVLKSNGRTQTTPAKVLAQQPQNGYLLVHLRRNKAGVKVGVHRLMCLAFYGPPEPGQFALHGDDIGIHNVIENLRWGTRSENVADSIRLGNHAQARKVKCPQGHDYDLVDIGATGKLLRRGCSECRRNFARERTQRYRNRKKAA